MAAHREPQRATLLVYSDGNRSNPIEVTVEAELRHGPDVTLETLATITVDYEPHGVVKVRVEKGEARTLNVEVEAS